MSKKIILILCILTIFPLPGCAWENLPEGGEVQDQKIIQVMMQVGGAKREDYFYYIVFNLSGDKEKKPFSVFDGADRGKYWTVYYMWGQPPYRELGLYRGYGGKGVNGNDLIDNSPISRIDLNELLEGTTTQGDQITLRIDLTELPLASDIINMNMIVCNQAIDAESKFYYEYEPRVFDSFFERGISMDLSSYDDYWSEQQPENQQEHISNEYEDSAVPEADIINWRFQKVVW